MVKCLTIGFIGGQDLLNPVSVLYNCVGLCDLAVDGGSGDLTTSPLGVERVVVVRTRGMGVDADGGGNEECCEMHIGIEAVSML